MGRGCAGRGQLAWPWWGQRAPSGQSEGALCGLGSQGASLSLSLFFRPAVQSHLLPLWPVRGRRRNLEVLSGKVAQEGTRVTRRGPALTTEATTQDPV